MVDELPEEGVEDPEGVEVGEDPLADDPAVDEPLAEAVPEIEEALELTTNTCVLVRNKINGENENACHSSCAVSRDLTEHPDRVRTIHRNLIGVGTT